MGRSPDSILTNRELSWLEFNQRVLDEAESEDVPLLDRLAFLSITASNLDEFFMVRVGGLELLRKERIATRDPANMTPSEQLRSIGARVHRMVREQYHVFTDVLAPALEREGIVHLDTSSLSEKQRRHLLGVFEQEVLPVVTPMALRPEQAFPILVDLGLYVAVRLSPENGEGEDRVAAIPIAPNMARLVAVPSANDYSYVLVEELLEMFIDRLFPGEHVIEVAPFRITRNADLSVNEDFAEDFISRMEEVLAGRKDSDCVRLEVRSGVSRALRKFLVSGLQMPGRGVYAIDGPLDLSDFMSLAGKAGLDRLRYDPWHPQAPPGLEPGTSMFEHISRGDILLYHPFDSFDPVVRLVTEGANDPDVLAIKQTLYRTGPDSPMISGLRDAAVRGKSVTVLVELKARFDEAKNIEWARQLERDGVQVIYGVKGLKTHCKLCIVVRREAQGVVRYLHFGTGNYNDKTARAYTDVSYLTREPVLGLDASGLFNAISGYSEPRNMTKLVAAPLGLRKHLLELIANETSRAGQGQKAVILAKMNSLSDPEIIRALYEASRAGVQIQMNVRGICCLKPGVNGLSENISVVSIVDRYLEHSRIFYFFAGGEERVFISSADWMPRNLDRRVELMVPVDQPAGHRKLVSILRTCLGDNVKGRLLLADGSYSRPAPGRRKAARSQETLYRRAMEAARRDKAPGHPFFEQHRPVRDN